METKKENQNSPIDVNHDNQKDCGAIFKIHNNTINGDVQIFV